VAACRGGQDHRLKGSWGFEMKNEPFYALPLFAERGPDKRQSANVFRALVIAVMREFKGARAFGERLSFSFFPDCRRSYLTRHPPRQLPLQARPLSDK